MVIFQSLVMAHFAPDGYFLVSLFRDEVKEVVVICPLVQQKVQIIVFVLAWIILVDSYWCPCYDMDFLTEIGLLSMFWHGLLVDCYCCHCFDKDLCSGNRMFVYVLSWIVSRFLLHLLKDVAV